MADNEVILQEYVANEDETKGWNYYEAHRLKCFGNVGSIAWWI